MSRNRVQSAITEWKGLGIYLWTQWKFQGISNSRHMFPLNGYIRFIACVSRLTQISCNEYFARWIKTLNYSSNPARNENWNNRQDSKCWRQRKKRTNKSIISFLWSWFERAEIIKLCKYNGTCYKRTWRLY